jgi:hemolysin activation/secretion protein
MTRGSAGLSAQRCPLDSGHGRNVYRVVTPRGIVAACLAVVTLAPFAARAQTTVERNPPPPAVRQPNAPPPALPRAIGSNDARGLGVNLLGLRVIGPEPLLTSPADRGVVIGDIPHAPSAALRQALGGFVGRPLSQRLINQIQTTATRVYRRAGYPFVSVITPPQEVTGGVLQLRVIEFRSAGVTVKGAKPAAEGAIRDQIAEPKGTRLNGRAIDEDFDWLNRYPYRTVRGVFSPGDALGESQLTLIDAESKPWQVFAGYSDTGTRETGLDRYFVGVSFGVPQLNDLTVSYQFTGSPDFWAAPQHYDDGAESPAYISHSAQFDLPVGYHQDLEFAPSYVAMRQPGGGVNLVTTTNVLELPLTYRTAVSNIVRGVYAGDVSFGLDYVKESRETFFNDVEAASGSADLLQFVAGWNDTFKDPLGRTNLNLRLVGNPGGLIGGDRSSTWSTFTNGRVTQISYAYGTFDVTRATVLPLGLTWNSQLSGLLAGQPLPDAAQIALGGLSGVRGYILDDASVDTGFYFRNELRLPSTGLFSRVNPAWRSLDQLSPYLFVDYGYGYDFGYANTGGVSSVTSAVTSAISGVTPAASAVTSAHDFNLASVGVGADYSLTRHLQLSAVTGCALHNAGLTKSGDCSLQARITASF